MDLLENKPDYMKTFHDNWKVSKQFNREEQVFDNEDIVYSYADFDKDILEETHWKTLSEWAVELNLASDDLTKENVIQLYDEIKSRKKNKYKKLSKEQQKFFNRASWLSLDKKGEILIKSFEEQFLPRITKVVDTQKYANIKDPSTRDLIQGFVDMVLEIKGYDKPIIFDLKTASRPYKQEDIDLSDQLTLYSAMKSHEYDTDLVGYVVLCKNIPKKDYSYCSVCGHFKEGRHKTCNKEVSGKRCNGEWVTEKKIEPEVQVLIEKKDKEQINNYMMDANNILHGMKNMIIYKNTSKCNNWYGGKCPFYNACHHNSLEGLRKKGGKK